MTIDELLEALARHEVNIAAVFAAPCDVERVAEALRGMPDVEVRSLAWLAPGDVAVLTKPGPGPLGGVQ